jgi:hypothetical protein
MSTRGDAIVSPALSWSDRGPFGVDFKLLLGDLMGQGEAILQSKVSVDILTS